MADVTITGGNGKVATFREVQLLTRANSDAALKAAADNKKDDVVYSLGSDLFLASGVFEKGFKPTSISVEGKAGKLQGVQLKEHESFWHKFTQGMNFAAVRVGAGAGLVGMLGGAWVAGTFFASSMPVFWGIAAGMALLGFLGTAFYQAKTGDRLNGDSNGAPQAAFWAQRKLHGE